MGYIGVILPSGKLRFLCVSATYLPRDFWSETPIVLESPDGLTESADSVALI